MKDFLNNSYNGVRGITVIDSGKKGQNIGTFAITHGNEPVGLKVFEYLINDFSIQEKLLNGKLYLISVNIDAYKKYIFQNDFLEHRLINHNMNRIYNKCFVKGSVEFERFKELEKIFEEIDIAVDLHSVSIGNDIIGITDERYLKEAKMFFDVENILVDDIVKTGALIGYFIDKGKKAFGLECGNHLGENAYKNGVNNVLNFLSYFGFINYNIKTEIVLNGIFKFLEEIYPKTKDFKYLKDYKNFSKINIGEIFAKDLEKYYVNNYDKETYLGLISKKHKIGDGSGFLFERLF